MNPRTTVIELFSTFIQFSDDRFDSWVSDWRLHKCMETHLAQEDRVLQPEEFWTLYWYRHWYNRAHQRAADHLHAYLQEPCYWTAQCITQRFFNVQWTLADSFQAAIAHTHRILKSYRPDYGSSLKVYARTAFSNLICDQLRQRQDITISSDWGLLRRLSQTQLKRALLDFGIIQTEAPILAWKCFKTVYTPDPRRSIKALPSPSPEQFAQITDRYNQLRLQLNPVPDRFEVEALVESLKQSVQAVRAHLAPAVTSLDQPQSTPDGKTPLDALSSDDTPMDLLLTAEVYAEQQQRIKQIKAVLGKAIADLAPADQTLLRLYYQEALTQSEIADQLHMQQYKVSRQLTRIRQQLLGTVARWSQETLHIAINSDVLKGMSDVIHEWLQQHYQPETGWPNEPDV